MLFLISSKPTGLGPPRWVGDPLPHHYSLRSSDAITMIGASEPPLLTGRVLGVKEFPRPTGQQLAFTFNSTSNSGTNTKLYCRLDNAQICYHFHILHCVIRTTRARPGYRLRSLHPSDLATHHDKVLEHTPLLRTYSSRCLLTAGGRWSCPPCRCARPRSEFGEDSAANKEIRRRRLPRKQSLG